MASAFSRGSPNWSRVVRPDRPYRGALRGTHPIDEGYLGSIGVPWRADFWVALQAAACFTYGSGNATALLKEGEAYARTTIDVDPVSIGGYGILARNLNFQVRQQAQQ